MEEAKTDTTYCINNECSKREECKRNCVHYKFDLTKNYWFMQECKNFKKEGIKDE